MCLIAYFLIKRGVKIEKCGRFFEVFGERKQVFVAVKQA